MFRCVINLHAMQFSCVCQMSGTKAKLLTMQIIWSQVWKYHQQTEQHRSQLIYRAPSDVRPVNVPENTGTSVSPGIKVLPIPKSIGGGMALRDIATRPHFRRIFKARHLPKYSKYLKSV